MSEIIRIRNTEKRSNKNPECRSCGRPHTEENPLRLALYGGGFICNECTAEARRLLDAIMGGWWKPGKDQ